MIYQFFKCLRTIFSKRKETFCWFKNVNKYLIKYANVMLCNVMYDI